MRVGQVDSADGRADSRLVLAGLAGVILITWFYLLFGHGMGSGGVGLMISICGAHGLPVHPAWTAGYAVLSFAMWSIMMAAMMLPGAIPAILRVSRTARQQEDGMAGMVAASRFTVGYLTLWAVFSLGATVVQWGLDRAQMLNGSMAIASTTLAASLATIAGLYQLSPWKQRCLQRCRMSGDCCEPVEKGGETSGHVRQGLRYGVSCLGCCSLQMCLPFIAGVMNVPFMVAVTLWVSAEKWLPAGARLARLTAGLPLAWGIASLASAAV